MTDLIQYEYRISDVTGLREDVRVEVRDGEPWFVAADVCSILDIKDASDAVARVDQADRDQIPVRSGLQNRRMWVVNESGLYDLVLRSDKPEARKFRRWITSVVLPTLRKTGRYEVAPALPKSYAEALRELAATVEERDAAQAKVIELHPKADAWDTLADTGADYSVRDAAYILNRDPNIDTGQRRLFTLLRAWGLIDGSDIPYASHAKHVTLRARSRMDRVTGERIPAPSQVRVTVAGLQYLHKRLGGVAPLDFGADLAAVTS